MSEQDHLFISYASEDGDLAEWLALRLASEGYRVWCDRTQLLGGESYPKRIDDAIKFRTFRLIALLSRASIQKALPLKERTIGLNIARERRLDFIIPLNVDGLSPTELDWMTSDLTFIPFNSSWADGFARLLKKLDTIAAPKDPASGKKNVCDWFAARDGAAAKYERLWTNLFPITELPKILYKFEFQERIILPRLAENWVFYYPTDSKIAWSFCPPGRDLDVPLKETWSGPWRDVFEQDGLVLEDVAIGILNKAVNFYCKRKGMKLCPHPFCLYFPQGLLPEDHLKFTNYTGAKTYVKAVGERVFVSGTNRERNRYHLAPVFRPLLHDLCKPVLRVVLGVHFTDLTGYPLAPKSILSRRKALCKNWWNHAWLSRLIAVMSWLSDGQGSFTILATSDGDFQIEANPLFLDASCGIDEAALKPIEEEDESVPIEEDGGEPGANFDDAGEGHENAG